MSAIETDPGWYERMAERASARRLIEEVSEHLADEADRERRRTLLPEGTDWLRGWPLMGDLEVLMGTGLHCAGCGRPLGVICVAFPDDWQRPAPEPDWRYEPETCPICPRERCSRCGGLLGGSITVYGGGQWHFSCTPGAST